MMRIQVSHFLLKICKTELMIADLIADLIADWGLFDRRP
jgi:hypothetical protein